MLTASHLTKRFAGRGGTIEVLRELEFAVQPGECVAIRGASGSGKSTLLMILGGLLHPDHGEIRADGSDLYRLSPGDRARWRRSNVGFVFQMFHLVPYLTVLDNVLLAAVNRRQQSEQARELLIRLGLGQRLAEKPTTLSAGEQQRTAVARALVNGPQWLLADEPTGNLDEQSAQEVFAALGQFRDADGRVVVVTHGDAAEAIADRTLWLRGGRLHAAPESRVLSGELRDAT